MSETASRSSTLAYLHTHGIEVAPEALDPMVREAVNRLQRTLYPKSSRADLTAAEVEALEEGGFNLEPIEPGSEDPLAQTVAEYVALLKSSLTTTAAADRLGVDPSRIRQRLTSQPPSLYGIRVNNGWYIPEFQFDGDRLIQGTGEVVARLDPELHPVSVFRWFTTPSPELSADEMRGRNLSPREWLRMGLPVRPVVELAASL
ncbi:MAG TPA: hypothetical protein VLE27_01945 [Thermoanaerobaculia bacterium]|nr:hypothetical protein [Thermoanaerobaculia bacterium]